MNEQISLEKRRYIRHPSNIPIEVSPVEEDGSDGQYLRNASCGGLCFQIGEHVEPGTMIRISIPLVSPPFEARVVVRWCRRLKDRHYAGIEFIETDDAFRARMVEQVCYIERYRKEMVKKNGIEMDGRQAALEWIEKYAKKFPL